MFISSPRTVYTEKARVESVTEENGETQALLTCQHGIWGIWGKYGHLEKGQEIEVEYENTPNGIVHTVKNYHVDTKDVKFK